MLLSTIICPQYLRGVGVWGRFRVCPSSLPFPSSSTVTSMRFIILHIITYSEKRDSHIATLFIRPYAKRPYSMAKSITIVLPYCYSWAQHAVFQPFGRSVYEPERVTSPLFRWLDSILDTSWTYLGHALQPHKEPCNRKYTPYFAPKCRFSSAVNATKKSQILLSGFQCKKSDFLNTFRV